MKKNKNKNSDADNVSNTHDDIGNNSVDANKKELESLMQMIENEERKHNNISIDYTSILRDKVNILTDIGLSAENINLINRKLVLYRYIDDINLLAVGSYIRWIPIKSLDVSGKKHKNSKYVEHYKLTNGGIIINITIVNDIICIKCKNTINTVFSITADQNIIFQKINQQEHIILTAMKYLDGVQ